MWTINEGIELINKIKDDILKLGHATALTGGVLFRGSSEKDLDILFYPLFERIHADYFNIINYLKNLLDPADFFIIDHKEKKNLKLVAVFRLKDERRIDFIFPSVLLSDRAADGYKTVYRTYADAGLRKVMLDVLAT